LRASIANPAADIERTFKHLHRFPRFAQGQKHVTETVFRQRLPVLVANLMINC